MLLCYTFLLCLRYGYNGFSFLFHLPFFKNSLLHFQKVYPIANNKENIFKAFSISVNVIAIAIKCNTGTSR
jgi:hypothetical protein